jgi:hypothetical protein
MASALVQNSELIGGNANEKPRPLDMRGRGFFLSVVVAAGAFDRSDRPTDQNLKRTVPP